MSCNPEFGIKKEVITPKRTNLRCIDSNEETSTPTMLGMFDYTFRNCAVFVYVELEPLCLVTLPGIDNLVKRTASECGNHLDDIMFLRTTCEYYFAFGIAKFTYNHIRNAGSPMEVPG